MPDLRMIHRARKGEADTTAQKNLGLQRVSLSWLLGSDRGHASDDPESLLGTELWAGTKINPIAEIIFMPAANYLGMLRKTGLP